MIKKFSDRVKDYFDVYEWFWNDRPKRNSMYYNDYGGQIYIAVLAGTSALLALAFLFQAVFL
jgi:hypothetical protein